MSVLETVLKNNRPLNRSQIEAAEQMLFRALRDKEEELRDAYSAQVEKKYSPILNKLVDEFNKKMKDITNKMQKEFTPEIGVRIESNYSYDNKFRPVGFDFKARYVAKNHPIYKMNDEINNIVLGMKLGENLKEEMLAVVNKINSIK